MKIRKNIALFRTFNQKVKKDLENNVLLKTLVGQELCRKADEMIQEYFEHRFDKELDERCFEVVSDSVELSAFEEFRLEEDGKLYEKEVTRYVLKELMYRVLLRYVKERQSQVLQAAG